MPDIWGLAAITTKFTLYLGILTAAGTVMATLMFQLRHTRKFSLKFGVLGFFAAILAFSLRGANLTGNSHGMIDHEMLSLMWHTSVGTVLIYRLAGLGLLITGLFMGRIGLWVSLLGGILAIWSFNQIGHISGQNTTMLKVVLTFHLAAVALWIGILSPLKSLVSDPQTYALASEVGHRFGLVAIITVPALIVAGGYMSYALIGSFNLLFSTGYGQALITKVILVTVLLGLAAVNKLRFIPDLRSGKPAAASQLSKSTTIEWYVFLAIFAVTASLTTNLNLPM